MPVSTHDVVGGGELVLMVSLREQVIGLPDLLEDRTDDLVESRLLDMWTGKAGKGPSTPRAVNYPTIYFNINVLHASSFYRVHL